MPPVRSPLPAIALLALLVPAGASERAREDGTGAGAPPDRLSETGLYEPGTLRLSPDVLAFSPRYALWSDGAAKRRWVYLPPGTAIDASDPGAWQFPPGTRFWKEFSHAAAVETRLIERLDDGTWRYAAYVWNREGTDAFLAPDYGVARLPADGAPGGTYVVPSQEDCRMCHEGGPTPVLGFSAFQLAADRDALAPNVEQAVDGDVNLPALASRGLVSGVADLPAVRQAPADALERTATGYLHANCAHCHNDRGPLSDLDLSLSVADAGGVDRILETLLNRTADSTVQSLRIRVVPGAPGDSQLVARMKTRNPNHQMPPLGTRVTDNDAVALVERWIAHMKTPEGNTP